MVESITENTPLSRRIGRDSFTQASSPMPLSYKVLQVLLHAQVAYFLYVIWSHKYTYFLWHPTLMLLFYYLTAQAISQYKALNGYDLNSRRKIHATIQHFSVASLLAAAVVVYNYKSEKKAPHYNAFHPVLGLLIILMVLVSGVAAYAIYFTPNVFSTAGSLMATTNFHRYMGFAIFTLATINIATGLDYAFDISATQNGLLLYPLVTITYLVAMFHQFNN